MPRHGSKAWEIDKIYHYTHHVSDVFPDDTSKSVTLTAGGVADTWGAWAAIVDNIPVELSTVFAAQDGHLVAIHIEECSRTDEDYMLEVAYGDTYVVVARMRFVKIGVKVDVGHFTRIRGIHIPAGETVYYRLMCETALGTAEVHFRYYLV